MIYVLSRDGDEFKGIMEILMMIDLPKGEDRLTYLKLIIQIFGQDSDLSLSDSDMDFINRQKDKLNGT